MSECNQPYRFWPLACLLIAVVASETVAQTTATANSRFDELIASGNEALNNRQLGEAERLFDLALAEAGDEPYAKVMALRCLADVRVKQRRSDEAVVYLETAKGVAETAAVEGDPWHELLHQLGMTAFESRQYEKGQAAFQRSAEDWQQERVRIVFLGWFVGALAKVDEAITNVRGGPAVSDQPGKVEPGNEAKSGFAPTTAPAAMTFDEFLARGDSAFDNGKLEEAERFYQQSLVAAGDAPRAKVLALWSLGTVRNAQGRVDEAISYLEAAVRSGEGTPVVWIMRDLWFGLLNQLSRTAFKAGEFEISRAAFQRWATDLEQQRLADLLMTGHVAVAAGKVDEATAIYRNCLAISDLLRDSRQSKWSLACLAYTAMTRGDADEALRMVGQQFERLPRDSFDFFARGNVHIYTGNWKAAEADLHHSNTSGKSRSYQAIMLEWVATARQGKLREANEQLRVYMDDDHFKGSPRQLAEWILAGQEGEPQLEKGDRALIDPYTHTCYVAAEAMLVKGRTQDARRWLKECLTVTYQGFTEHAFATAALIRLDEAEKSRN